jgi:protein SCO1/2
MRIRWIAAGIAAAAAVIVGSIWTVEHLAPKPGSIGGPFVLVDTNGQRVTDRDLAGKPTVIYFGFTYCPEVCPTTLAAMGQWIHALGADADKLNFAFVSIDPERDTPSQMKLYLSSFDPHIRGLTGTSAQIARITGEYRVYVQKIPLAGGSYTMDHSSAVYLMDRQDRFVGVIAYQEPPGQAVKQLQDLARNPS